MSMTSPLILPCHWFSFPDPGGFPGIPQVAWFGKPQRNVRRW